jgi:hypothetical protein
VSNGLDMGSAILIGLVIGVAVAMSITLLLKSRTIYQKEREKATQTKLRIEYENRTAINSAESEAGRLTSHLTKIYESSSALASQLPQHLNSAWGSLQRADEEFNDNAFGPFWDAVENSAQHLAAFDYKAKEASRLANEYYRGLNGRVHTFPLFPLNDSNFLKPSFVVGELRRVVRMGQTNFQFANIWEHRRTREVMIAGFRTLDEAVSNLESTVGRSLFDLEQSVSSGMAQSVTEEIKTRDSLDWRMREQNRMLDNIQHHRRP